MATPDNILQQVETYQDAAVAYLDNLNCFVPTLNTKLVEFENKTAQLGTTVNIELPYRYRAANGLVINFQASEQRLHPLTVMQAKNIGYAFTEQDFIYNTQRYMEKFGKGAIEEISAEVEKCIALNAISAAPVMTLNSNGQSIPTGALKTADGPFRFYGDGTTPINSFGQLAKAESFYREYGAARGSANVYLPNMAVSAIIDSGLNQFVNNRNEKMAMSWDLGTYKGSNCNYMRSNLLPVHTSGNLGEAGTTLTVVSINAAGTQLTLSGAGGADANAIKSGDLGQFLQSAGLNFLTFIGHSRSDCPVQFRIISDAASSGGNVTVDITPPLISDATANQNINTPIIAGMQLKFMPSHKAGLLVGGDAFYLAMPPMPRKVPYPTANKKSTLTGVSVRNYYGSTFGGNLDGYVNDLIFDNALLQDYCMRLLFPLI